MSDVQISAVALLLGLLGIAVVSDLRNHRIPNLLVLLGLVLGVGPLDLLVPPAPLPTDGRD